MKPKKKKLEKTKYRFQIKYFFSEKIKKLDDFFSEKNYRICSLLTNHHNISILNQHTCGRKYKDIMRW